MSTGWVIFIGVVALVLVVTTLYQAQLRREAQHKARTGIVPVRTITQRRWMRAAVIFMWVLSVALGLVVVAYIGLAIAIKAFPN